MPSAPADRPIRRARAAAAAVALALAVAPGAALAAERPVRWSQFQGGAAHEGETPDAPAPPYRLAWTFREPETGRGLSAAVVAGDLAFTVGVEGVYAVDLATGEERWSVERSEGPLAPPALGETPEGELVLLFTEGIDDASSIVAVDVASQEERWRADLAATSRGGVSVEGKRVFVGDDGAELYGFDLGSGDPLWTPIENVGRILAPPAVGGGRVFATFLDPNNGNMGLVAVDAASGEVDWRFEPGAPGAAVTAPSVIGDRVLAGFHAQALLSFAPDSGEETQFARVNSLLTPLGAVTAAGEDLLAVDRGGGLYRLDGADGERIWSFQLNEPLGAAPVVAGSTALVGLDDGRLAAIDVGSARLVWEGEPSPGALGPIALGPDVVVVAKGGRRGGLVAYEHDASGTLLDVVSPTVIAPTRLYGNFLLVFVVLTLVLFGIARGLALVIEPPGGRLWVEEEGDEGDGDGDEPGSDGEVG